MRAFIAIELSKEIRENLKCLEDRLSDIIHGIKWIQPDNIHLTLKFLGNIEEVKIPAIKNILDDIAKDNGPFKLRISNLGTFPSPSKPRVIWVGIDSGEKECAKIASDIEDRLIALGVEKEARNFHPHLTLARIKFLHNKFSVTTALAAIDIRPEEMKVTKLTLFRSDLTSQGAIYQKLYSAQL